MITIKCQLLAKEHDFGGYTCYVFKNLDSKSFLDKYVMTVRWPNWQHRNIEIGEIGYLTYRTVIAGKDEWWDGTKNIPFNYSNIIFIKFIKDNLKENTDDCKKIIL